MWAENDALKMFPITNGVLATTATAQSSASSAFPGATPVVSSNGTQNGIVWALETDAYNSNGSSVLYAFNANNVAQELYDSNQNSNRDNAGTSDQVHGSRCHQRESLCRRGLPGRCLRPSERSAASGGTRHFSRRRNLQRPTTSHYHGYRKRRLPFITPPMGRLRPRDQQCTPAPSSSLRVRRCRRLPARADTFRAQYRAQPIPSTRRLPCRSFLRRPAPTRPRSQLLFRTARPEPSSITRRMDRLPRPVRQNIRGQLPSARNTVINAIATDSGLTNSNVASASYTIQPNGTGINYGNGFASVAGLTLNGSATNTDDSRLQLTTGGTYQASSVFYNTPTNIQAFTTSLRISTLECPGRWIHLYHPKRCPHCHWRLRGKPGIRTEPDHGNNRRYRQECRHQVRLL